MEAKYKLTYEEDMRKAEHTVIAEKALGKSLPFGAEVHHANGNRYDNRSENLVICPSRWYHKLLHTRMRAVAAGYPPHYRNCKFCGKFEAPENIKLYQDGYRKTVAGHSECFAKHAARTRQKKRVVK